MVVSNNDLQSAIYLQEELNKSSKEIRKKLLPNLSRVATNRENILVLQNERFERNDFLIIISKQRIQTKKGVNSNLFFLLRLICNKYGKTAKIK